MSIYATWLHLHAHDEHEAFCGRWVDTPEAEARAQSRHMMRFDAPAGSEFAVYDPTRTCTCGQLGPIVYQGSHVNPQATDARGGFLEIGAIPNHCHPDARGDAENEGAPVEFLRICLGEDPSTYHGGEPGSATVVLERAQVEALRDTLSQWLETDERW